MSAPPPKPAKLNYVDVNIVNTDDLEALRAEYQARMRDTPLTYGASEPAMPVLTLVDGVDDVDPQSQMATRRDDRCPSLEDLERARRMALDAVSDFDLVVGKVDEIGTEKAVPLKQHRLVRQKGASEAPTAADTEMARQRAAAAMMAFDVHSTHDQPPLPRPPASHDIPSSPSNPNDDKDDERPPPVAARRSVAPPLAAAPPAPAPAPAAPAPAAQKPVKPVKPKLLAVDGGRRHKRPPARPLSSIAQALPNIRQIRARWHTIEEDVIEEKREEAELVVRRTLKRQETLQKRERLIEERKKRQKEVRNVVQETAEQARQRAIEDRQWAEQEAKWQEEDRLARLKEKARARNRLPSYIARDEDMARALAAEEEGARVAAEQETMRKVSNDALSALREEQIETDHQLAMRLAKLLETKDNVVSAEALMDDEEFALIMARETGVIDMSSVVEADLALAKQLTMEEISELENAEQRRRVMEASDLLYAQNLYEEELRRTQRGRGGRGRSGRGRGRGGGGGGRPRAPSEDDAPPPVLPRGSSLASPVAATGPPPPLRTVSQELTEDDFAEMDHIQAQLRSLTQPTSTGPPQAHRFTRLIGAESDEEDDAPPIPPPSLHRSSSLNRH